jgi:pantoate--beta-alanine ligase
LKGVQRYKKLGKQALTGFRAKKTCMILFKKAAELMTHLSAQKAAGSIIGFAPTMGALHQGHISLLNDSRSRHQLTVCSIFVNPTQFNNAADFDKYPVTIEKDIDLLEGAGCDVLFLPPVTEMYPGGMVAPQQYELGQLEAVLEGSYRPGHFQGVCQVVHRLLDIVQPGYLYLGQKDYQQCMVIKKLIEILGLNTELVICPTLREASGLAMSSRNMRLTEAQKVQAAKISETLLFIKNELKPGFLGDLKQRAANYLAQEGFKVDYIEIANADNLKLVEYKDGDTPLVALAAAFLNDIRLIDNMLLN